MPIKTTGNFDYKGPKPLDSRQQFATIAERDQFPKQGIATGLITYVLEDKKFYKFVRPSETDLTQGSWEELISGDVPPHVTEAINNAKQETLQQAQNLIEENKFNPRELQEEIAQAKGAIGRGDSDTLDQAKQYTDGKVEGLDAVYLKQTDAKAVSVESAGLVHKIKWGSDVVGTINVPQDVMAQSLAYKQETKELVITLSNGSEVKVSVADLIDTYTAGTGLQVSGNQFSLTTEYAGLKDKVATLEAKPSYELGFTSAGDKVAVQEEGNKLFVQVPQQAAPAKATAEADGLMSKEHFAKLEKITGFIFAVTQTEFDRLEGAGELVPNAIYGIIPE